MTHLNEFTGSLQCRFIPGSQHVQDLGDYLQDHPVNGHNPYFVIQQTDKPDFPRVVPLSQDVINDMRISGFFNMELISIKLQPLDQTDILLCVDHKEAAQRISGFPRSLQREEFPRGGKLPSSGQDNDQRADKSYSHPPTRGQFA